MTAGEQPKKLERGMVLVAPSGDLAGQRLRYLRAEPGATYFERAHDGAPTVITGQPWPWEGWVLGEPFPGLTIVQSLRAFRIQDADAERDVRITRPGPWGNQFSIARHGMLRSGGKNALDLYREWLDARIAKANRLEREPGLQRWIADLRALAGKRLLCACAPEAIRQGACHGVPLAMAIERLTEVGYELAPGTEKED